METKTFMKLSDIIDGSKNTWSAKCEGVKGCPSILGYCQFANMPKTCIHDMIVYVSRRRCPLCEIPIDVVMDHIKGV